MDKYYTPDISDLFVGYECEAYMRNAGTDDPFEWEKYKIPTPSLDLSSIFSMVYRNHIRTPYLTKEQIEKEGWKYKWKLTKGDSYVKEPFNLVCLNDYHIIIELIKREEGRFLESFTKFAGECLSINEFRKICKLLEI